MQSRELLFLLAVGSRLAPLVAEVGDARFESLSQPSDLRVGLAGTLTLAFGGRLQLGGGCIAFLFCGTCPCTCVAELAAQVGVVAFERVDLPAMGGTRRTQLFAQLICRRTEPFVGVGLLGRTRRRRGAFGLDGIQRGIERVLPALATG